MFDKQLGFKAIKTDISRRSGLIAAVLCCYSHVFDGDTYFDKIAVYTLDFPRVKVYG